MYMKGETEAHREYAKYMSDLVKVPVNATNNINESFSKFREQRNTSSINQLEKPINHKWYNEHGR